MIVNGDLMRLGSDPLAVGNFGFNSDFFYFLDIFNIYSYKDM